MKPFKTELSMALRGKLGTPWRMWLAKRIINWVVAVATKLVPDHKRAGYPTAMWWYQLEEMKKLHKAELDVDTSHRARDENFMNLLQLLQDVGCYLSTTDPYYRLWIGYFFRQAASTWLLTGEGYKEQLVATFEQLHSEQVKDFNTPEFLDKAFHLKTCGGLYELEQVIKDATE